MKSIWHCRMMEVSVLSGFLIVLGLLTAGCGQNALLFYEGTKFGFAAEYKPDSSQPLSTSLGYKRRIAAVVPPQEAVTQEQQNDPNVLPRGEALSLVSVFKVTAEGPGGVAITNHFASGMAARVMTKGPQAAQAIGALFAPATVREIAGALQERRVRLAQKLAPLDEQQAKTILTAAGFPVPVQNAKDALQDHILHAQTDAALSKLEAAFSRLP